MQFYLELKKAYNELESNPAALASCEDPQPPSEKNREVTKRNFKLSSRANDLWVSRICLPAFS